MRLPARGLRWRHGAALQLRFRGFKGFRRRFKGDGGGFAAVYICRLAAAGSLRSQNRTTGLRPWKCTPIPASQGFPRMGKSSCHSSFVLIRNSKIRAAKISPSGGDVAAGDRRGAFPSRRRRGFTVFPAAAGGFKNSPLNQPALWAEPIGQCAST